MKAKCYDRNNPIDEEDFGKGTINDSINTIKKQGYNKKYQI